MLQIALACLLNLVAGAALDARENRVLMLDGDGDYVALPVQPFADLRAATVEFWVQWRGWTYFAQPWGFGVPSNGMMINQEVLTNTLQFFAYSEQALHLTRGYRALQLDQWYHVAVTAGRQGLKLYLNGVLIEHNEDYRGGLAGLGGAGATHVLGGVHWEDNAHFNGRMDQVRIWSEVRSQRQVRANMHRQLRGDERGLVALYDCEGDGLRDATGQGRDGVLMGDAHCASAELPEAVLAPAVLEIEAVDAEGDTLALVDIELYQGAEIATEYYNSSRKRSVLVAFSNERTYDLRASHSHMGRALGAWELGLRLSPGQRYRKRLVLRENISISGYALTRDRQALGGVTLQAVPAGHVGPAGAMASNASGHYYFNNLKPGTYRVRAYTPQGYVYYMDSQYVHGGGTTYLDSARAAVLRVAPGAVHEHIDFHLPEFKKGVWSLHGFIDGLAHNRVHAVLQHDGFVYFATPEGLSRYDGAAYRTFTTRDGLIDDEVQALAVGMDGALWVGTSAGLSRWDGDAFTNYGTDAGLVDTRITALAVGVDGALWIGTSAGLSRWDGTSFVHYGADDGLVSAEVKVLYAEDSAIWIGTNIGLSHWDGQRFANYTSADGLFEGGVDAIVRDGSGVLWIGMVNGLVHLPQGNGARFVQFPMAEHIGSTQIYAFVEDRAGRMWMGTGIGLSRWDGRGFTNFYSEWASHGVNVLGLDDSGAIWADTGLGVWRIDDQSLVNFTTRDGLSADDISDALIDDQGRLVLATKAAGLSIYDGRTIEVLGSGDGMIGDYLFAVHQDDEGALWTVSHLGVSRWDGEQFQSWDESDGFISWPRKITSCTGGAVYLGMSANGMGRYQGGVLDFVTVEKGLASGEINALYCGRDDALWIGHPLGATRWDGDEFRHFTERDGLSPGKIQALYEAVDGTMWFGSQTQGLAACKGGECTRYGEEDGLVHKGIMAINQTRDGLMVFATEVGGVALYDGEAWSSIDTRDGLRSNGITDVVEAADGTLYFASSTGFTRYSRNQVAPSVRIVAVQADSLYGERKVPDEIVRGHRVTIEYAAIDLVTQPEKRQYRYRLSLAGEEGAWQQPTRATRFEWVPAAAGEYVFEVQAIDRDLNYSPAARVNLRVVPPWYLQMRVAFPVGISLSLLVGALAFTGWRYYGQRREAGRLREQLLARERRERQVLEKANSQLEEARREAEAANQAKSVFLANMSHEIRTPLNAILGYAQILQRREGFDEDVRHSVETIEQSGSHLLRLINGILDLSKIEAGREELVAVDFELAALLREVEAMFGLPCRRKGLEWRMQVSEEAQWLRGDEGKLRQVLINLVGNAVKFTSAGWVELRVERAEGDAWRFAVADSGSGIEPAVQERIFAPFEQQHGAQEGTGLGLAIARRHVELMGGRIEVESAPGEGTVFSFVLPLPPGASRGERTRWDRVQRLAPGQVVRVLVVDDIEQNREIVGRLLEEVGAQVRLAASGEEGLQMAAVAVPDLVLMDIRMPGMGGEEAMRALWRAHGKGALKIVALSASVLEHERRRYIEAGFDAFLDKPLRAGELFRCMGELLGVEFELNEEKQIEVLGEAALPEVLHARLVAAAAEQNLTEVNAALREVEALGMEGRAALERLRPLVQSYRLDEVGEVLREIKTNGGN